MLVFINLRTVSYHLAVLTGYYFFVQIKNETKIAKILLILFLFLQFPKNKKIQHPNPEFGHLAEIQKKTCKKRRSASRGAWNSQNWVSSCISLFQYWVLGSSFKLITSRFDFLYHCNWGFLFSAIYLCATIFRDLAIGFSVYRNLSMGSASNPLEELFKTSQWFYRLLVKN